MAENREMERRGGLNLEINLPCPHCKKDLTITIDLLEKGDEVTVDFRMRMKKA